jgi:hypothetical protein
MASRLNAVVVAALSAIGTGAAQAAIVTFSGDTTGGPTFNRPFEDLSAPSAVGTAAAYDLYRFTVDATGVYTFLSTAAFDNLTYLYAPTLNPAQPLVGALLANDDLLGPTTSGFSHTLQAGTAYALVTTGFENFDRGQFVNTIGGPGMITAVPEPASALMLVGGLLGVSMLRRGTRR